MATVSKKNRLANRITSMIMGILMGLVLLLIGLMVGTGTIIRVALIVWGVIIILSNIPGLINSIVGIKEKGSVFDLICSLIGIILGVALIIGKAYQVFTFVVGAYMLIFPVIRIILAKSNWGEQLKREALRIILGVLLIVFGGVLLGTAEAVLNTVLWVIGAVIMALSAVFGLVDIIRLATKKPVGPKTYVDEDGDGTIDRVE